MRIIFVLKVQETLNPFLRNNKCMRKYFDLRFVEYNATSEYKFIRSLNRIFTFLDKKFTAKDNSSIKLDDPQKRLEHSINQMAFNTNLDLKLIKENLANQINDSEIRLANSQKRLEDSLVEMSRKTTNSFESTQEDSSSQMTHVQAKLEQSQRQIVTSLADLHHDTNVKLVGLKQSLCAKINNNEMRYLQRHAFLVESIDALRSSIVLQSVEATGHFQSVNKTYRETSEAMDEGFRTQFNTLTSRIENIGSFLFTTWM